MNRRHDSDLRSVNKTSALATCAMTIMVFCASTTWADDVASRSEHWPTWRGPSADGRAAADANPPIRWSATTNIAWKTPIPGRGSNTPIIWEDHMYLLTAIPTTPPTAGQPPAPTPPPGEGQRRARGEGGRERRGGGGGPVSGEQSFVVMCLNRHDGSVVWQKEVHRATPHEGLHMTNTYASASAVTDGERLYASFGSYGVYCLTLDGEVVWSRDLGDMRTRNAFGEGGSPALHEDTLIVPWDHEGPSKLFALNALTGETRWEVDRDEPTAWATPLITEFNGRWQVVTNGTNRVRSYDLESGKLIWECGGQASNPIPTPLRIDDLVICMTGFRGYAIYAIPLDSEGDITGSSQIAWSRTDSAPYVASAVLVDGELYFGKGQDAIASVVDARTGEVLVEPTRLPGLNTLYASPMAAAGRIYFSARNGNTVVVEREGNEFRFLATNELGETLDASPVAIGNHLYLRGENHLFCIQK